MNTVVGIVEALVALALIGVVVLHPQLPVKVANTVTDTIVGAINLSNTKGKI